jgi:hypothetical protein
LGRKEVKQESSLQLLCRKHFLHAKKPSQLRGDRDSALIANFVPRLKESCDSAQAQGRQADREDVSRRAALHGLYKVLRILNAVHPDC